MYTTASGVPIPQGTDAFNPGPQFKGWADAEAVYDNFFNVALDSNRTSLAAPQLRDGIFCWVRATATLWAYLGSTWTRATLIDDTGWITISSFLNGWSAVTPVMYRVLNRVVYWTGTTTGGTTGAMFLIPVGARTNPANVSRAWLVNSSGSASVGTRVDMFTTTQMGGQSGGKPVLDAISYPAEA